MMAGMGRIFSYADSATNDDINADSTDQARTYRQQNNTPSPEPFKQNLRKVYRDDKRFYSYAQVGLESNGSDGEIAVSNTRWVFQTEWRLGFNSEKGFESETHIGRLVGRNQWLMPYIGFDWRYRKHMEAEKNLFGQVNTKDQRAAVCFGFQYTLPMLVTADARIDTDGRIRLQLGREDLAMSKRLRFRFFVNSDKEYMTGLRYIVTKHFAVSTHYDSDMGLGAGLTITY